MKTNNYHKLHAQEKITNAPTCTYRYVGQLIVYADDPWYPASTAVISNVNYKSLPAEVVNAGKASILIIIIII